MLPVISDNFWYIIQKTILKVLGEGGGGGGANNKNKNKNKLYFTSVLK